VEFFRNSATLPHFLKALLFLTFLLSMTFLGLADYINNLKEYKKFSSQEKFVFSLPPTNPPLAFSKIMQNSNHWKNAYSPSPLLVRLCGQKSDPICYFIF
jgi:hypothetical protein